MGKNCFICEKKCNDDEVIHAKCFPKYRDLVKTPNSYRILFGKNKGLTYNQLKEKHPKYFKWLVEQQADEETPIFFFQYYHKKFEGEEPPKKSKKRIHEENRKKDNDELSVYGSSDEEENI